MFFFDVLLHVRSLLQGTDISCFSYLDFVVGDDMDIIMDPLFVDDKLLFVARRVS